MWVLLKSMVMIAVALLGGKHSKADAFSISSLVSPRVVNDALIEIRPARIPEDLKGIRECRQSVVQKPGQFRTSPRFLNADALTKNSAVVCILARQRLYPWRVLGTADVRVNTKKRTGFVTNVYVREEERGKGLGTRLITGVEDFLGDFDSVDSVSLNVNVKNVAAMSLYRRCGYVIPGIDYAVAEIGKATGLSLLVSMRKDLRPTSS
jgi:ribosomal protein S18 acetylase RimI-like enzyme